MYKSIKITTVLLALLVFTVGHSQSKKRTKKEVFTVNKDVTLEINTSHADVEFDTWNKNKIEIEATIEIEDATDEEIEAYMKKWNFKAIGNSDKVTVTSKGGYSLFGQAGQFVLANPVVIEEIETPIIENLPRIQAVPELPIDVLESLGDIKFDYEAFEKDGEAYMKEWQKQWKTNFDGKKFKEEMEKWKEEFMKQQEEMTVLNGKVLSEKYKVQMTDEQKAQLELQLAKVKELAKAAENKKTYKVAELLKEKEKLFDLIQENQLNGFPINLQGKIDFDMIPQGENVYFFSDGNKRLKIKKTIKIKMPKKAKLKLNVRHGEVTIAAASENIHAKLSHAALYATSINGANTMIESSYAPIHVTKWNQGSLKVNFVENVDLQLVNSINLMANSSKINIGTLGQKGIISGTIGKLLIHNISDSFETLDIILENTDARIQLPTSAFKLYYVGSNSGISYPESVVGTENKTQFTTIVRGYQTKNTTNKEININAKYSEVLLNEKS
ncbi:hypothetical protein [Kordia jejudonensis]|uniref:hypothetical protein n=1 Tax=Kordia jejudonensis TaxID=1348245 RepID=UPI0006292FC5|nr:hypothetical protein [Kordia jejudonensis]